MTAPPSANRAEGDIDHLIRRRFFPRPRRNRVCVDVGAARPDYLSVSALFRSLGWRVLAVEPNPDFVAQHRALGHEVLPFACGDRDRDDVDFFVVDSHGAPYHNGQVSYESYSSLGIRPAYSALQPDLDTRTIKVPVRRLDTLLARYAPDVRRIDLLLVDVEGWEQDVLRGLDLARHRPRVIVMENLFDDQDPVAFMKRRGYERWRRVVPNDIYVYRGLIPHGLFRWIMARQDLRRGVAIARRQ